MADHLSQSDKEFLQSIINNKLVPETYRQSAERQLHLDNHDAFESWYKIHAYDRKQPDKRPQAPQTDNLLEIHQYTRKLVQMPQDQVMKTFGVNDVTAWQIKEAARLTDMFWDDPKRGGWDPDENKMHQELRGYIMNMGYNPPQPTSTESSWKEPASVTPGSSWKEPASVTPGSSWKEPEFVLHKKGTIPPMHPDYGIDTHTIKEALDAKATINKWEGLDDIVKEATTQSSATWGDIADINPDTGLPEGGAASYIDTSRPETPDEAFPNWNVPAEIPIGRVIGEDPLAIPKPYNPWQRSTKKTIRLKSGGSKSATSSTGGITSSWNSADAERWGKIMLDWTAMQTKWQDSLSAQNAQTQSLSESAASIAYSNRFRMAKEVARFDDADKRREFLQAAGIDPDAAAGRHTLGMAELLAERDAPKAKPVSTWEEMSKDLETFDKGLKVVSATFAAIGRASNAWQKEFTHQAQGVYDASSYFVPAPFKQASSRLFQAHLLSMNSDWTRVTGGLNTAGASGEGLSGALMGATSGMTFGGPWGALIGGIGGAIPGIVKALDIHGKTNIKATGEDIRSRINLWSGITELVVTPLRMLGNAAKSLWGHFRLLSLKLVDVVSKFNQLGLPLTSLTGVTYGDMQRSYRLDSMIGAQPGTTNKMYNSFAGAQMDLYTLGQMDESRVIAAAMTGTFSDVYGNGGDTQAQYANTLNKIYARMQGASPREQQRLMNLAGKIDNTMPARLQQMRNLGVSDYNTLKTDSWLFGSRYHQYTATQEQRARYTRAGMQVSALSESISESRNVIAERLWSTIGLPLMGTVNEILHNLAETGNWRGALEAAKAGIKQLWSNIAKTFELPENFGDFAKGALKKGIDLLWSVVPEASKVFGALGNAVLQGLGELVNVFGPALNQLIARLGTIKLDFNLNKLPALLSGKATLGEVFSLQTPDKYMKENFVRNYGTADEVWRNYWEGNNNLHIQGALSRGDTTMTAPWGTIYTRSDAKQYYDDATKWQAVLDYTGAKSIQDVKDNPQHYGGVMAAFEVADFDQKTMGPLNEANREYIQDSLKTLGSEYASSMALFGRTVADTNSTVRVQIVDSDGKAVAEYERTSDGNEFMRTLDAAKVQIVNNTMKIIGNQGE